MLFGFALAVIVGFLFTAGRNWTNRPTPTGPALAALAALWVAGRCIALTPFAWAGALVEPGVSVGGGGGARDPLLGFAQPAQLLLRRSAGRAGVPTSPCISRCSASSTLPAWLGIQLALDVVLFIMA